MSTSMPSMIMERGSRNPQNVLNDGLGRDLMNAGRFCFSCEQIFANRRCLEEHVCSAASHICSCGTEFSEYKDMLEHSTTHEPGHQVLDHETIRKRRIEKRIEEEEKLKRLQTGEVVWQPPKLNHVPSISLSVKPMLQVPITSDRMLQVPITSDRMLQVPITSDRMLQVPITSDRMLQVPITSARMSQVQVPPAQISQVPKLYPSMSQASFFPNPVSSTTDMQNIFAGVGAPTVDLWTLYQPVVLLRTVRKYNRKKPYSCGKCGQCFLTKTNLISHHSSHVTDKVSGCVGCGLLLSSKKVVPRFHVCNSPNTTTKFRLVTARPPSYKRVNVAVTDTSLSAQGPQATSSLLLKSQNLSAVSKDRQTPHVTSTLPLTNENIRTYSKSNHRLHATQSLQSESPKPNASKSINVSLPSKSQNPSASSKSNQRLPDTPSLQLNTPTNCASSSRPDWFTCRVCHLPFETAQLLQRHKCIKAKEFMAQHGLGRQQYKLKRVTQVASPISAHMNGVRKVGIPAPGNIRKSQVMAISLDKGQGAVPMNRKAETDRDDDCYIVEGGPDKPAEMIYQVTSSVPIKT